MSPDQPFPQTEYFRHTRHRVDRAIIKDEWIEYVIGHPDSEEIQSDGRIRRWARISGFENRALRVILPPDGRTVPSALFDHHCEEQQR